MTLDPITTAADFTRLLEAEVSRRLGGARLTLTRYATLVRADNATAADLAPQVGVTQQMVSKTVRELQLLGYVTAVPSEDRRRRVLQVTTLGHDALTHAGELHLPPTLLAAMERYVAAAQAQ